MDCRGCTYEYPEEDMHACECCHEEFCTECYDNWAREDPNCGLKVGPDGLTICATCEEGDALWKWLRNDSLIKEYLSAIAYTEPYSLALREEINGHILLQYVESKMPPVTLVVKIQHLIDYSLHGDCHVTDRFEVEKKLEAEKITA